MSHYDLADTDSNAIWAQIDTWVGKIPGRKTYY